MMLRTHAPSGRDEVAGSGAEKVEGAVEKMPEVEMPVQRSESYFVSHAVVTLTWLVGLGRWGLTSKGSLRRTD